MFELFGLGVGDVKLKPFASRRFAPRPITITALHRIVTAVAIVVDKRAGGTTGILGTIWFHGYLLIYFINDFCIDNNKFVLVYIISPVNLVPGDYIAVFALEKLDGINRQVPVPG